LETNIARTFAALSATNEAILYAKSPEELYRQVCEAAFSSGDFLATAIFSAEPGTHVLRFATGFGEDIVRLRSIDISVVADTSEGSGVCGQAFRDQKLTVSNDFLNDTRSLAWRKGACDAQVGAAAAGQAWKYLVSHAAGTVLDGPEFHPAKFNCFRQTRIPAGAHRRYG